MEEVDVPNLFLIVKSLFSFLFHKNLESYGKKGIGNNWLLKW